MSKTLQELEREITETTEALYEADYQEGAFLGWQSFYSNEMPQEKNSIEFCREYACKEYDKCKVLAARLNELYEEYRRLGGTRKAFVNLCLDPSSNNWGILRCIDEFPWISMEEWEKVCYSDTEVDNTENPDIRKLFHGSRLASLSFEPTIFDVSGGGDACMAVWAIDDLKNNPQAGNTPCAIGDTFLQAIVSTATGRAHPYYEPQFGMSAVIEAHQEITLDEFRVMLASHEGLPFVFFHTGKMPPYKIGVEQNIRLAIVGMGGFFGYTSREAMKEDGARLAELHTTEDDFPYYSEMIFEVQESLKCDASARIYLVKNPFGPGSLELLSNTAEFTPEAGNLHFVGHSRCYVIGYFQE